MPMLSLTISNIKKIVPPDSGRVDYFDTALRGFYLRVSADYTDKKGKIKPGAKVFYVQVDVLDSTTGKYITKKKKVGAYGELTPEEGRDKAFPIFKELRAWQPTTAEQPTTPAKDPTLSEMVETYLANHTYVPDTVTAYRLDFGTKFDTKFKSMLGMRLSEIGQIPPDEFADGYTELTEVRGPFAAKKAYYKLQAVLRYARVLYPKTLAYNPCAVIGDLDLWPADESRDDCLKGTDFKAFHKGIKAFNEVTHDAILFCLYHGLRRKETVTLKWEYINWENETLTIPDTKARTKNNNKNKKPKPLIVPLSSQSLEILKRRRTLGLKDSPFVFASSGCKTGHIYLSATQLAAKTGLEITIHGLRRTFSTTGEKLKLRRQDIDKLINHVDGTVTGKHYACTDVDDLREPLQLIANEIEQLMIHGIGTKKIRLSTGQAVQTQVMTPQ